MTNHKMLSTPYKFKIRKDGEEYLIRIWKTAFKQEAIVRVDAKEAIFKFTKLGAEFVDGERFSEEYEEMIKVAIMQYCFNWRIHT